MRSGRQSNQRHRHFRIGSGVLDLLWLPESRESAAGVLTRWRDLSGLGHHGTPAGSPAVDETGVPGVRFNGAGQYINCALSGDDQPSTWFVLKRTVTPNLGDRATIVEVSDTGGAFRGTELLELYGSAGSVRDRTLDDGSASYVVAAPKTQLMLNRADFGASERVLLEDGKWKVSSAVPAGAARAAVYCRVGQRLDGAKPWDGVVCAVVRYRGSVSLLEREYIERLLLARASLSLPFSWVAAPDASNPTSDPLSNLPPVLEAIVGRPTTVHESSIHLRDGRTPAIVVTSDLPLDTSTYGAITVTPPAAGDYTLSFTEGAHTYSTTVRAAAMLAPGAAQRVILAVGDSITRRGASGWLADLQVELGARALFVGTQGPATNYHVMHEGHDSWLWATFNSVASPFWSGGVLDVAAYLALLAAPPDVILWSAGQNGYYSVGLPGLDAAITVEHAHLDTLIAAFSAELPDVIHGVSTAYPLGADLSIWGSAAAWYTMRTKANRYARATLAHFGGREAENIIIRGGAHVGIDPVRGYDPDLIHPNSAPGGRDLARAELAWLVAHGGW